jgi:hypothetical protein
LLQLAFCHPARGRRDQFDLGDRRLTQAIDFAQPGRRCVNGFGERAEFGDQRFGQRLDVAPGQRAEQHHLQQFIVAQGIRSGAKKALAQPHPMAVIMRRFGGRGFVRRVAVICGH